MSKFKQNWNVGKEQYGLYRNITIRTYVKESKTTNLNDNCPMYLYTISYRYAIYHPREAFEPCVFSKPVEVKSFFLYSFHPLDKQFLKKLHIKCRDVALKEIDFKNIFNVEVAKIENYLNVCSLNTVVNKIKKSKLGKTIGKYLLGDISYYEFKDAIKQHGK